MLSRSELEQTPEGRIAAVARDLVVAMYQTERKRRQGLEYPNVPDHADFADALRVYVRREILKAQLEAAKLFAPYAFVKGLFDELNAVEFEIAKLRQERK